MKRRPLTPVQGRQIQLADEVLHVCCWLKHQHGHDVTLGIWAGINDGNLVDLRPREFAAFALAVAHVRYVQARYAQGLISK